MFGKLKIKTADELLGLFKELSEKEQAKVLSSLNPPKTEDEAQIDEAEEHIEERGEEGGTKDQTEKDIEYVSVGEQEHLDGDEPAVKDDGEDRYNALVARMDALEATLTEMRKAQEDAVDEEHDRDFGMSPSTPDGGEEDDNRYKRVMRSYAKNNSNQYL